MPLYQFEAKDVDGKTIRDVIDMKSEQEARDTITNMGYVVTQMSIAGEIPESEPVADKEQLAELLREVTDENQDDTIE